MVWLAVCDAWSCLSVAFAFALLGAVNDMQGRLCTVVPLTSAGCAHLWALLSVVHICGHFCELCTSMAHALVAAILGSLEVGCMYVVPRLVCLVHLTCCGFFVVV